MKSIYRMALLFSCLSGAALLTSSAACWGAGVCLETGYHEDVQGRHPKAKAPTVGSGEYLKCRWEHEASTSENRFGIYYNTCDDDDECTENERISHNAIAGIANYLQCAWDLFLDSTMAPNPQMVFKNPLNSPWMDYPGKERIPVWILKKSGGGGANNNPFLLFPAHERVHDPVTENVIHEFGHIIVKAYPHYLAGGSVPLFNEGLPTFFAQVLRDDLRYAALTNRIRPCGADRFIDLSRTSLRSVAYCSATPFWNFVASFSTAHIPGAYENTELTPACRVYLADLDVPPGDGKMKHIAGRDLILAILEAFDECYPLAFDTPACTQNGGYGAYCSRGTRYVDVTRRSGEGCQPDDQLFSMDTDEERYERRQARGELGMPLAMEILDGVIRRQGVGAGQNPRYRDGVRYPMFRHFLEWNYEREGAEPSTLADSDGYLIKAFGAHYHEIDISSGTKKVVLEKGSDLSNWAYGVFYKSACPEGGRGREGKDFPTSIKPPDISNEQCRFTIGAVKGWDEEGYQNVSGWDDNSSVRIKIPADPRFDTAVVIVTAFEGTYDPQSDPSYAESGSHYQFRIEN